VSLALVSLRLVGRLAWLRHRFGLPHSVAVAHARVSVCPPEVCQCAPDGLVLRLIASVGSGCIHDDRPVQRGSTLHRCRCWQVERTHRRPSTIEHRTTSHVASRPVVRRSITIGQCTRRSRNRPTVPAHRDRQHVCDRVRRACTRTTEHVATTQCTVSTAIVHHRERSRLSSSVGIVASECATHPHAAFAHIDVV
jgi:hypothetical protein